MFIARIVRGCGFAIVLSGLVIASTVSTAAAPSAKTPKMLEFDTMVALPQAFTGTQAPIRGINGGGLPWAIDQARGELDVNGKLEVQVRGLVLAAGANAGINPLATFRAVVSCLADDRSTQNLSTLPFAATSSGDADIEAFVTLPRPCIAPIVFVTSAGGAWLATTGH